MNVDEIIKALKGTHAAIQIQNVVALEIARLLECGKENAEELSRWRNGYYYSDMEKHYYNKGRQDTIDEFIKKAEEEKDNIFNWDDDDYENGMKAGYQYSIEIADKLKEIMKEGAE